MAIIGNNADTLLQGLSDFWLRYFRDIGDLQALYEGTSMLVGQVYLDLMSSVLNVSAEEVPLFNKDFYRLLPVREDQLVWQDTGDAATTGYVLTTERFGEVPSLQNKVYAPSAALEEGYDYVVGAEGGLTFFTDPTDPPLNGYAQRPVDVMTGGFFTDEKVANWRDLDVKKGDSLELTAPGQGTTLFTVMHVAPERLALSTATPAPYLTEGSAVPAYSWRVVRTRTDGSTVSALPVGGGATGYLHPAASMRLYEVVFWAVDAQVDDYTLYENFGHVFSGKRASTEAYRAFVRGLMQLYALGPAIDRIESALNVTAGLPVVREDDEVLVTYEPGSGSTPQAVVTTKNTYTYASDVPLRPDVMDPAQVGLLRFRVFEPLTQAVQVVDHIKDPTWWHDIVIPEELMPGADALARTATPQLFPLVYGPKGRWRYGDLNVRYGADEDGVKRANIHRHCAAFELMDRYLKHHMFCVRISQALDADLAADFQRILREQKPAHTTIYFQSVP